MRSLIALFVLLALPAWPHPAWADDCPLGGSKMVRAELLFGRSVVSNAQWADFLATIVTPRFPDGLTVLDGHGQWRDPSSGRIGAEPSTVLLIVAAESPDLGARLNAVRDAFKSRFHQQSVGLVTQRVCAGF